MKITNSLAIICIFVLLGTLLQETNSVIYYYGDQKFVLQMIADAIESGLTEVKSLIQRQFWFMLRGAEFDTYQVKLKADYIQYKVNYTSTENIYAFDVYLNKATWKPEIKGNRTYKAIPVATPNPTTVSTPPTGSGNVNNPINSSSSSSAASSNKPQTPNANNSSNLSQSTSNTSQTMSQTQSQDNKTSIKGQSNTLNLRSQPDQSSSSKNSFQKSQKPSQTSGQGAIKLSSVDNL